MPRKPRIELAGKYHIINRGVAQMHIFKEPADYEQFEELMCFYPKALVLLFIAIVSWATTIIYY